MEEERTGCQVCGSPHLYVSPTGVKRSRCYEHQREFCVQNYVYKHRCDPHVAEQWWDRRERRWRDDALGIGAGNVTHKRTVSRTDKRTTDADLLDDLLRVAEASAQQAREMTGIRTGMTRYGVQVNRGEVLRDCAVCCKDIPGTNARVTPPNIVCDECREKYAALISESEAINRGMLNCISPDLPKPGTKAEFTAACKLFPPLTVQMIGRIVSNGSTEMLAIRRPLCTYVFNERKGGVHVRAFLNTTKAMVMDRMEVYDK